MPSRIYIDQCHLDDTHVLRRLRARALRGEIIAPVSVTHLVETLRARPEQRAIIAPALIDLSRGYVIRTEVAAAVEEAEAFRSGFGRDWVRDRLLSTDVWALTTGGTFPLGVRLRHWMFPPRVWRLFDAVTRFDHSKEINDIVMTKSVAGVAKLNAAKGSMRSAREMLAELGVGDAAAHLADDQLVTTFRAVTTRRALQAGIWRAKSTGLHQNDPMDVAFLCVALPYLDAVCVDKAMYARIEETRATVGIPWARAFKRLPDLVQWLDES